MARRIGQASYLFDRAALIPARALEAAGHRFMTGEEATAWIEELRSEWDDRLDELNRLRDRPAKEQ